MPCLIQQQLLHSYIEMSLLPDLSPDTLLLSFALLPSTAWDYPEGTSASILAVLDQQDMIVADDRALKTRDRTHKAWLRGFTPSRDDAAAGRRKQ
jgi:hypothetical protein